MRTILLFAVIAGAASQGSLIFLESFGSGWAASPSFLAYGTGFTPSANYEPSAAPANVLRLLDNSLGSSAIEFTLPMIDACGMSIRYAKFCGKTT